MALFTVKVKRTPGLCGVPPIQTTPDDPFWHCCIIHDEQYEELGCESTKEIDQQFYQCCLRVAGTDKPLQLRAKFYYRCCRIYGSLRYAACRLGLVEFKCEGGSCSIPED